MEQKWPADSKREVAPARNENYNSKVIPGGAGGTTSSVSNFNTDVTFSDILPQFRRRFTIKLSEAACEI
jgi:hypothetical protein